MENRIEKLGLGTWAFGGRAYGPLEDELAKQITMKAYSLGIRFFDTAHLYAEGKSEEILGETIGHLPDAKICTKIGYEVFEGKPKKNYHPSFLDQSLSISLKRLRRPFIDLLLLHNPDKQTLEDGEVFTWLKTQKESGKIKKWGVSLYDSAEEANICLAAGAQTLEARYSVLRRDIIDDIKVCPPVQFIARSPLDGGLLSGKYDGSETFPKTDQRSAWPKETFIAYQKFLRSLSPLMESGEVDSLAELALRFSAFSPKVSIVVPGAKSLEQLEQLFDSVKRGPLSDPTISFIDEMRGIHLSELFR